ncbi:MAG TPA: hypothetical protein VN698_03875 [Bacteroidia bacterium]|nr:hypothetical protein [Bacteroidia bacterium]
MAVFYINVGFIKNVSPFSTDLLKLKLKFKQTKQKISSCLSRNRRVFEICVVLRSNFISILNSLGKHTHWLKCVLHICPVSFASRQKKVAMPQKSIVLFLTKKQQVK